MRGSGKNKAHKARGRENAENAKAVQRAFPRPPAPFCLCFLPAFKGRVLGCGARARSAKVCGAATAAPQCIKAALVYAKHTPRCQIGKNQNCFCL